MVDKNYAIAMSEVLHFLKGFSTEEIDKIPDELINFFKENADETYKCDFDYNEDIENLHLKDETYGLISMICYNYWCETPEEKKQYLKLLEENEKEYQKYIDKKYNPENMFMNKESKHIETAIDKYDKEKWYKRFFLFLKKFIKNNNIK